MTVTPGLRIGKYEVGGVLGKGSFGVVYLARDVELGREVAIKFLRPEFLMRDHIAQRFLQEARAAAKIGHPGIVTVFECGLVSGTGTKTDGTAYIVMERLQGDSLGDRIAAKAELSYRTIVAIGRQLAAALHAAHAAGIIHRDLKPDNVFLIPDVAIIGGERVKVLDFGIAKLDDPGPGGVHTHSRMILGTPRYMSPEQARSSTNVDARSDIYALGCMLYELISGRAPFEGDGGDIMFHHQATAVPPVSSLIGNVPEALDKLLRSMLEKPLDKRPPTMQAVDAALGAITGGDAMPAARSKKFVDQRVITGVVEPPRPPRMSAAGELETSTAMPSPAPSVDGDGVEVDMFAEVTDPDLRARAKSPIAIIDLDRPAPRGRRITAAGELETNRDPVAAPKPEPTGRVEVDLFADVTARDQPRLRRAVNKPPTPSEEWTAPVRIIAIESDTDPVERTDKDLGLIGRAAIARRTMATRGGLRPIWIAAGVGAVLLVAIVLVATRRGGGGATTIPDAAIAVPPPDAPDSEPREERAWIESECKVARADKNWRALQRCGRALVPHAPDQAHTMIALATSEIAAAEHVRAIGEAARAGDLATAETHGHAIPLDSSYREEATTALRGARALIVDRVVEALDGHAAAHDCTSYDATLAYTERAHGGSVRAEIVDRAQKCKPKSAGVRDDDHLPDAAVKPIDCTDTTRLAELESEANARMSTSSYVLALSRLERLLPCKPSVLRLAYLAACHSRNFAKAKIYFKKLGSESLAQICMKDGFDPR